MASGNCFFVSSDEMLLKRMRTDPQGFLNTIREYERRAGIYYEEAKQLRAELAHRADHGARIRQLEKDLAFFRRLALLMAAPGSGRRLVLPRSSAG